ncbi:MAG: ATP-binding protein, partial [Candidatus Micrarchaeia archaeon]
MKDKISKLKKENKKRRKESEDLEDIEKTIPKFNTTAEIKIPEKIIDQIIGQDKAVEIVKKAAAQRRNVLLLGSPGTGKSMLAQGMAELMPAENLRDVLVYPNEFDENNPKIKTVLTYPNGLPPENAPEEEKIGQGRKIILASKMQKLMPKKQSGISWITTLLIILIIGLLIFQFVDLSALSEIEKYSSIIAAIVLG